MELATLIIDEKELEIVQLNREKNPRSGVGCRVRAAPSWTYINPRFFL